MKRLGNARGGAQAPPVRGSRDSGLVVDEHLHSCEEILARPGAQPQRLGTMHRGRLFLVSGPLVVAHQLTSGLAGRAPGRTPLRSRCTRGSLSLQSGGRLPALPLERLDGLAARRDARDVQHYLVARAERQVDFKK